MAYLPKVGNGMSETILVLEDDRSLMEGIRDMLELAGYTVLTAGNGVEGLRVMQSVGTIPNLIVSDIMMPEMDGYAFLDAVQKNVQWIDIPFIFLTAKGEKEDVREGRLLGVDDYVIKPFDADDLMNRIAGKLRRSQILRASAEGRIGEMKRRILTILHHEFRTPLTYVVAYADLLNRDVNEMSLTEVKELLGGVNSGAERLRRLIENFMLLVELEMGEVATTFAWRKKVISDVQTLLYTAVETCGIYAQEKNVRVEVATMPSALPQIVGDEQYLQVVISRLLDNAIKFSDKPNSTVMVRVAPGKERLYFSVIDHGRGIPAAEFDKIFEPFYQIDRGRYEDQGAGTGLAIVKRVVDLHHGEIKVESTVGLGSTITVGIPVAQD